MRSVIYFAIVLTAVFVWHLSRKPKSPVTTINMLSLKDERWKEVYKQFKQLQTKPSKLHVFTPDEQDKSIASKSHPEPSSVIDNREKQAKKSGTSTDVSEDWYWMGGKWARKLDNSKYEGIRVLLSQIFNSPVTIRGIFYYPPGGYREWHSNRYDPPGTRLYLIGKGDGESAFYYHHKYTVHKVMDNDGTVNIFKVSDTVPFYHSVQSDTADRWSLGFLVEDEKAVERLLR
jgi:cbb3-type cytochrome oxidase subunit 3